jgi:hypothetical protein
MQKSALISKDGLNIRGTTLVDRREPRLRFGAIHSYKNANTFSVDNADLRLSYLQLTTVTVRRFRLALRGPFADSHFRRTLTTACSLWVRISV